MVIFMFPSKCMDQSRHFNLFNNSRRIKKLQANHTLKLVIYFCLSLHKSFYRVTPGLMGDLRTWTELIYLERFKTLPGATGITSVPLVSWAPTVVDECGSSSSKFRVTQTNLSF